MEKPLKTGILSLYYKNYNMGGLLQAYALQKTIEKMGVPCEQICVEYEIKKPKKEITKQGVGTILIKCQKKVKRILVKNKLSKRLSQYYDFMEEIPHSSKVYTLQEMPKCNSVYQTFVVGSDQVWADWLSGEALKMFSLQFAEKGKKRISYAASFAADRLTEKQSRFLSEGVEDLDAVSVREQGGLKMAAELGGKHIELVADPVLLLEEEDWNKLADSYPVPFERYAVSYFLGKRSDHRRWAKSVANENGFKLVNIAFANGSDPCMMDCFFADFNVYDGGPKEFVDLIRNAELVLTDSFHAMIFSLIFSKPFLVVKRHKDEEKNSMNGRILDCLSELSLQHCLADESVHKIPVIDYIKTHEILKKKRQESLEFLISHLK